ncbi:MAG: alcohol dehydrogenase [Acidobacteria bacterium]|nr:MAG: alcohol dehydrogenase [Acidobacteriota bacterium]
MRTAVMTEVRKPWTIKTLPDPRPQPGQVLIRIRASGMCGTDLHAHHGVMPVPLPIVLGHEPVGEIVEVGAGVDGLRAGDRVGVSWTQKGCGRCRFCQERRESYCAEAQTWVHMGGGNSELMLAWASGCTLVPQGLSDEAAAPIFCAGYTVMSGLRNAAPKPGERVAVLGLGGLGHLAVQYAKALGLEVFALTGSAAKKDEARRLGADQVIVAGDDLGRALLDAGGADVILGTTNSAAHATQALRGLRPEGRMVNMGLVDGAIQADPMHFLSNQVRLVGSRQNQRRDLVEALVLATSGKVKPMIEVYPLDRVNEVRDRLEAGKVRYRAVIKH